jgi:quinoprotein glucose dehydrogenase
VTRNGQPVDAVAQITKTGHVWLLDRDTGAELFPSAWRKMPPALLDGDVTADSQRFPTLPKPFALQQLTEDLLTDRTPEARAAALRTFRENPTPDPWTPPNQKGIIIFPGVDGGGEYGGPAFDPKTGLLYVNSNEMGWILKVVPREEGSLFGAYCAECHGPTSTPIGPTLAGVGQRLTRDQITTTIRAGTGRMPAFATALGDSGITEVAEYFISGRAPTRTPSSVPTFLKYRNTVFDIFLDHEGYPAIKPPWGTLNAIDLNTGETKWSIPFGEYPKLVAQGLANTGSDNYGGAIVTENGLLIIAATTYDNKIRAFDKANGKLLWEGQLPAAANTTPSTYMVNGTQYIVIACGGGKNGAPSGGTYVAFALP